MLPKDVSGNYDQFILGNQYLCKLYEISMFSQCMHYVCTTNSSFLCNLNILTLYILSCACSLVDPMICNLYAGYTCVGNFLLHFNMIEKNKCFLECPYAAKKA